jgi:hypothetical protein
MSYVTYIASESHFLAHLLPLVLGCGEHARLLVAEGLGELARQHGVVAEEWEGDGPSREMLVGSLGPIVVASHGDLCRVRGTAPVRRRIVVCEHGSGQSYGRRNPSYANGGDRQGVSLALVPGPTPAAAYKKASPHVKVVQVGLMRRALLEHHALRYNGKPAVCFSFHWARKGPPLAPELQAGWPYWLERIKALSLPGVELLGHAHPRAWETLAPLLAGAGLEPVREFSEVLARATTYVCDNSSTLFEFAAASSRPIVMLDHPGWDKRPLHGLRFGEAGEYFLHCGPNDDLGEVIKNLALRDSRIQREVRREGLDLVYQPWDGGMEIGVREIMSLGPHPEAPPKRGPRA